jgi:hypothetical protein
MFSHKIRLFPIVELRTFRKRVRNNYRVRKQVQKYIIQKYINNFSILFRTRVRNINSYFLMFSHKIRLFPIVELRTFRTRVRNNYRVRNIE